MADDVKFCASCGASIDGGQASEKTVTSTPATNITAKSFRCNGCGESLKIPKNARGVIKCPSCKTECVLDGLIKNAEMADKENINSGFPLTAKPVQLHKALVSLISENPNSPFDVFERAEVIREEHYCIPAYSFEYNGEAPFSYEEGKQETRQERGFSGDSETITTIKEVKWHTERGTASVSGALFVSGNKNMVATIQKLYAFSDPNQLVDFDYLEFPSDVQTLDYDLPQLAAFNEYVKPIVDELLIENGKKSLENTSYEGYIPRGGSYGVTYAKNFKIAGSKIQKDITRVFFGLYRIVYKYGDKEYSMWVTGDGDDFYTESLPENLYSSEREQLKSVLDEKTQFHSSLPKSKLGLIISGLVACLAGSAISFFGFSSILFCIIFAALAIPCGIFIPKIARKGKEHNENRANAQKEIDAAQKEIDDFNAQLPNAIQRFKEEKKALLGIYKEVSGNVEAF